MLVQQRVDTVYPVPRSVASVVCCHLIISHSITFWIEMILLFFVAVRASLLESFVSFTLLFCITHPSWRQRSKKREKISSLSFSLRIGARRSASCFVCLSHFHFKLIYLVIRRRCSRCFYSLWRIYSSTVAAALAFYFYFLIFSLISPSSPPSPSGCGVQSEVKKGKTMKTYFWFSFFSCASSVSVCHPNVYIRMEILQMTLWLNRKNTRKRKQNYVERFTHFSPFRLCLWKKTSSHLWFIHMFRAVKWSRDRCRGGRRERKERCSWRKVCQSSCTITSSSFHHTPVSTREKCGAKRVGANQLSSLWSNLNTENAKILRESIGYTRFHSHGHRHIYDNSFVRDDVHIAHVPHADMNVIIRMQNVTSAHGRSVLWLTCAVHTRTRKRVSEWNATKEKWTNGKRKWDILSIFWFEWNGISLEVETHFSLFVFRFFCILFSLRLNDSHMFMSSCVVFVVELFWFYTHTCTHAQHIKLRHAGEWISLIQWRRCVLLFSKKMCVAMPADCDCDMRLTANCHQTHFTITTQSSQGAHMATPEAPLSSELEHCECENLKKITFFFVANRLMHFHCSHQRIKLSTTKRRVLLNGLRGEGESSNFAADLECNFVFDNWIGGYKDVETRALHGIRRMSVTVNADGNQWR